MLDLPSPVAAALSLISVSKRFGATQALENVDLSVGRGEVVALMGANGAGKSTLAKIAAGVTRPDTGSILVSASELRLGSPRSARTAGIVIVHQSTDQLGVPGLTVAENLVLDTLCGGGAGAIVSRSKIAQRARQIAASIGFDAPLDQDFGALGPAHRQLVAIARAVAAEAPVLILDEPTASLSAPEAERLFTVVDRLRGRGVGVLYISHRLGDIRRIADRIVVLRNGRRVAGQAKQFDFAAAVRAMIGRNLDDAARSVDSGRASEIVLSMSGVRLIPGAANFDLVVRGGRWSPSPARSAQERAACCVRYTESNLSQADRLSWTARRGDRPARPIRSHRGYLWLPRTDGAPRSCLLSRQAEILPVRSPCRTASHGSPGDSFAKSASRTRPIMSFADSAFGVEARRTHSISCPEAINRR
jgi:ABC-type branched-subunit amino acid transport system ATPase component